MNRHIQTLRILASGEDNSDLHEQEREAIRFVLEIVDSEEFQAILAERLKDPEVKRLVEGY